MFMQQPKLKTFIFLSDDPRWKLIDSETARKEKIKQEYYKNPIKFK